MVRSMTNEIMEGRGCGPKDHIHLNLSHLDNKVLEEKLPGITESAKIFAGLMLGNNPFLYNQPYIITWEEFQQTYMEKC